MRGGGAYMLLTDGDALHVTASRDELTDLMYPPESHIGTITWGIPFDSEAV